MDETEALARRAREENAIAQTLETELARYAQQREAKAQVAPASRRREPAAASNDAGDGAWHFKTTVEQVVQVRLPGVQKTYGYVWRGAEPLEVGDWVTLPPNASSPKGSKGCVEGFGRDGYGGPLKEVVALVERPDAWVMRMEAVTTKAEARQTWMAAKRAGLDSQRLLRLERVGREVLGKGELGSATLKPATEAAR